MTEQQTWAGWEAGWGSGGGEGQEEETGWKSALTAYGNGGDTRPLRETPVTEAHGNAAVNLVGTKSCWVHELSLLSSPRSRQHFAEWSCLMPLSCFQVEKRIVCILDHAMLSHVSQTHRS